MKKKDSISINIVQPLLDAIADIIVIDEEFSQVLPAPSEQALQGLEQSLLKEGCLDPLTVYEVPSEERFILVDGHQRYRICKKHKLKMRVRLYWFESREHIIGWISHYHISRRNLTAEQCKALQEGHEKPGTVS